MANISQIAIGNSTYDIKDTTARITISSTLTLTVAGWDSTTKQQTVLTTIDTTKRNVVDITVGELPTWSACNVYAISESATGVTFQCDTIPSDALTFKITSMAVTSNA